MIGATTVATRNRPSYRWSWVIIPLSIFVVTRILGWLWLSIGATRQPALDREAPGMFVFEPIPASPTYWQVLSNWDGQWYKSIATSGYPSELPMADGAATMNEWAFFPLFPFIARLMMSLGFSFEVAGALVSMTCAAIAVVLLFDLVREAGGRWAATTVALGLCCFPAAPIFQVAYSEGLALLLLVLTLRAVSRRRYAAIALLTILLALTRAVVLPLAALLTLAGLWRFWQARETFPRDERWTLAGLVFLAGMSAGLWPLIAAVVTGVPGAFTETQKAWPLNQGDGGLLANWFIFGHTRDMPTMTVVAVLAFVALLAIVARPATKAWGGTLRAWSLLYPLYLLLATRPSPSIARYMLLGIGPLAPFPDQPPKHGVMRHVAIGVPLALAVIGLMGQYLWVTQVFTIQVAPDQQPFP